MSVGVGLSQIIRSPALIPICWGMKFMIGDVAFPPPA